MTHLPGKFVWFEHLSHDIPKARKFYERLFGWHTEAIPMGERRYSMVHHRDEGMGGYVEAPPGVSSHWIAYVSVPDVAQAHAAALAAGARQLMAPAETAMFGWASALMDPSGAPFCLWKGRHADPADKAQAPVGTWCWNELWTFDDEKALSFYGTLLGYTSEPMEAGGPGRYHLLRKEGVPRGGVMRSPDPKIPAMWLPYVSVADCDASAAKAVALGARVVHGPQEIPNIGRFTVLLDPLGAAIAVIALARPQP